MFYETAQTVGPGWHRSYKPSHYEDMNWQPSSKNIRSPGSSPETYRRIIRNGEEFPSRTKEHDDEFFSGRRSPTFPRRIFKEVWNESSPNHRFTERPRMFKRVFRPDRWEDEFDNDIPHLRRVEREFDRDFDGGGPTRKFDEDFEKRFNSPREFKKSMDDEFEKSDGKVHHIPIMVEKRIDEMKSRFGKNDRNSPPPEKNNEEDYAEEWIGPQVQRLRKSFEQPDDEFTSRYRVPKVDINSKPRPYMSPNVESWDPHAIHTLPTRKAHKSSQSFDDSRHPVPPKSVYRSYSETHEDSPRQSQQQHSAAFRSHSDGHCPEQTYVTKIKVNLPSQKEKEEQCSAGHQSNKHFGDLNPESSDYTMKDQPSKRAEETVPKGKGRNKYDNPSMQQIAVVLQNVEDLVLRVDAYNGAGRDKQYRFLDEMLTRCMLRLDDVDTEGREDIRTARKAAVREVQNCIDKLEAKADESERRMRQSMANTSESKKDGQPNQGIPLQDKVEESDLKQNKAIPLPAKPNENAPDSEKNKAIPLPDKPGENKNHPEQNKPIPLGYTQDNNNHKSEGHQITNEKNETGEQTKL